MHLQNVVDFSAFPVRDLELFVSYFPPKWNLVSRVGFSSNRFESFEKKSTQTEAHAGLEPATFWL